MIKLLPLIFLLSISCFEPANNLIGEGQEPKIGITTDGTMRVVYGKNDKIYCSNSNNNGETFSLPDFVGEVKGMHLGMGRGPQIACSANYSIVTAMDKSGNIHSFQLSHKTGKWIKTTNINDIAGSAPEGLMTVASDKIDNFYAIWLDLRGDKKNKIFFSSTTDHGKSWMKNILAYKSPDKTVCECCKPNIVIEKSKVFIMFRNWLNGARDMYLMESDHKKILFSEPVKLGYGTWKLNGCPMDGGGIVIDNNLKEHTTWQRKGIIYYARSGQKEIEVGKGRNCKITLQNNKPLISWEENGKVKIKTNTEIFTLGEGDVIEAAVPSDNRPLCVWVNKGKILFKKL
jgi:hypothetical protein